MQVYLVQNVAEFSRAPCRSRSVPALNSLHDWGFQMSNIPSILKKYQILSMCLVNFVAVFIISFLDMYASFTQQQCGEKFFCKVKKCDYKTKKLERGLGQLSLSETNFNLGFRKLARFQVDGVFIVY